MSEALLFFVHYWYWVLFFWIFLEQLGMPLPSTPVLLTAGTLSATHAMDLTGILLAVLASSLLADSIWFFLGRHYGSTVTRWICKFSMEAASCVRKTEDMITTRGAGALVMAKFVPGLNLMAAPLAGQSKMEYRFFLVYDSAGTLLWATSIVLLGRFFGDAIRRNQQALHWMSHFALGVFVLLLIGLLVAKVWRQQAFLHKVRTMRVAPQDLKAMLDRGEDVYIVDLRHPLDYLPDPRILPGAVRLLPNELMKHNADLPRDRDIILYCTCPSEATSAKVALTMRRFGIERIRPLRGGFDEWKQLGYPLIDIPDEPVPTVLI
ncbi:MAG TPA: rhodanese-like domain-containing protein [Acidobacteriaceae bacterium]|nr:rhodanese-like domain-containing protein [Acidobacteriaceae bacterium]